MALRGYVGRFGTNVGALGGDDPLHLTVRPGPAATNPSYLTLAPDATVLYAATEIDEGGAVGAYAIEGHGLRPLGAQPTDGAGACHVSVDPAGRYLLTAHYGSGSVAVHRIAPDGSVGERADLVQHVGGGPNQDRQSGSHAHMVIPDPSGGYVLAVDLGTDTVYRYRLENGRLRPAGEARSPSGAGLRHLAFHPSGRYAHVANELDSTASVLDLDSFEVGATLSTVADLGPDVASQPSAIRVAADGKFCYVANRGPDTIAVLVALDDGAATLRLIGNVPVGGQHPRGLPVGRRPPLRRQPGLRDDHYVAD